MVEFANALVAENAVLAPLHLHVLAVEAKFVGLLLLAEHQEVLHVRGRRVARFSLPRLVEKVEDRNPTRIAVIRPRQGAAIRELHAVYVECGCAVHFFVHRNGN